MKLLVIVPAYNEEKNIISVCEQLKEYKYDFLVINDCSTDKTEETCRVNKFKCVNLIRNLGIGGAVQTGYRYAYENGYDYAIQVDGDGQHDVRYIDEMVKCMQNKKCDMVIGSRFIEEKSKFKSTKIRRLGISLISKCIKLCTKKKIFDPTSGFRLINKETMKIFSVDYPVEYPEPISIVSLLKNKKLIEEIPVEMYERKNGKSSISAFKNLYYMFNVIVSIFIVSLRGKNNES